MTGGRERCLTCGDVAVEARVADVRGAVAVVEVAGGGSEEVALDHVAPVERGDLLLCHAGIALERLEQR